VKDGPWREAARGRKCVFGNCHSPVIEVGLALVEDLFKSNLVVALALGGAALILPKVLPDLSPPLRTVVKTGLSLFVESEAEAEGGIISRLAEATLKEVLNSLNGPGSEQERQNTAQAAIRRFKRTARSRARRYGRDEQDRFTRYQRHIGTLNKRMHHVQSRHSDATAAALQNLSASLTKPQAN